MLDEKNALILGVTRAVDWMNLLSYCTLHVRLAMDHIPLVGGGEVAVLAASEPSTDAHRTFLDWKERLDPCQDLTALDHSASAMV